MKHSQIYLSECFYNRKLFFFKIQKLQLYLGFGAQDQPAGSGRNRHPRVQVHVQQGQGVGLRVPQQHREDRQQGQGIFAGWISKQKMKF